MRFRGAKAVKTFCDDLIEKVGLKDFRAFEDDGALRPDILVVDHDEVVVSGSFSFNAIQGRFLSQTWRRVGKGSLLGGDVWKIKSQMIVIDGTDKAALEKNANKTVGEELDIVEKAEAVIHGKALTPSDAKELEHDIADVAATQHTNGTVVKIESGSLPWFSVAVALACGGVCCLLVKSRRTATACKYNFGNVEGPDRMLG